MTITVTKEYRTETAHRLMDYVGKCAHLHGHSYLWQVTAVCEHGLDRRGMVVDFKDLKVAMEAVLEPMDHALVLKNTDPLAGYYLNESPKFLPTNGCLLNSTQGQIPRIHIWDSNPTAENFAEWAGCRINSHLTYRFTSPVLITSVKVWETSTSFAEWRA